jgi:hypothetical protein
MWNTSAIAIVAKIVPNASGMDLQELDRETNVWRLLQD